MTGQSALRARAWTIALALEAIAMLGLLILGAPDPKLVAIRWGHLAIMSTAGIVGWLAVFLRPTALDPRIPIALALLVLAVVPAALASPYPSIAWPAVWLQSMAAGTAALLWQQAASPAGRRNMLALLAMILVAIVVVYLVTVAREWFDWLGLGMSIATLPLRPGNLGGLLPIPTWLGDAIVAIGPIAVVTIWRARPSARILAIVIGLAALLAIVLSGTRSIWLMLPLGGLIFVLGTRPALLRRTALIGGAAAAITIGLLAAGGTLGQLMRDVDEGRSSAFSSAIRLFLERPLTGGGPGTYGVFRLGHDVERLEWLAFPSAHNLVLNALAETGIIGVAGILVAALLLVATIRDATPHGPDRAVRFAGVAGIAMLLGHAMVDVVMEQPGLLVLGISVAGLAIVGPTTDGRAGISVEPPSNPRLRGIRRGFGGVVAVSVAVVAVGPALRAESAILEMGTAEAAGANPQVAAVHARRATELAPDLAPAWTTLAVSADTAAMPTEALMAAERAADLEGLAQHHVAIAWLLARSGSVPDATVRRIGAELRDPFVLLNLAMLREVDGAPVAETSRVLARLLAIRPDIGGVMATIPGDLRPLLPEARATAVRELLSGGQKEAALLVALTGQDGDLQDFVRNMTRGEAFFDAAIDAWSHGDGALARFESLVQDEPRRPWAINIAWLTAARHCDEGRVARWAHIYRIQYGATLVSPVVLGRVPAVNGAMRPTLYPESVWRVNLPARPYVAGTWLYQVGTPSCL